nr:hypothetical protein [Anaeroplasmataceae bacterium]
SVYLEWLKVKNNHLVITKKSIFITNRFKKKKEYKVDLSNCYLALKPSVKRGGGIWLQFYDNQDNFICDYEDVFNHASLYGEEPTRWEEAIKELNIPIIDVNEVIKN